MTAYTELKVREGSRTSSTAMQRGSEKRKSKASCAKKSTQNTGTEKSNAQTSAAVTTDCCAFLLFFALYFVIRRDTVSGIPEDAAVISTAKTESAI